MKDIFDGKKNVGVKVFYEVPDDPQQDTTKKHKPEL